MSILTRLLSMFRAKEIERDLEDEVRFHLEELVTSNIQRGMERPAAEAAAREQFGDIARIKSGMREVHMINRRVIAAFALGLAVGVVGAGLMWRAKPASVATALPQPSGPSFYRAGQDGTTQPVLVHEAKPKYTSEAMHAKIQGTVLMECVVQPAGMCDSVRVTRSLEPGLDREAMNALQAWRFQPGQRQGKPVPVLVTIEIAFTLRS